MACVAVARAVFIKAAKATLSRELFAKAGGRRISPQLPGLGRKGERVKQTRFNTVWHA